MPIPPWALLLSFWLHMLATVVWIGGLAALAIIVLPTMRRSLKPAEFSDWLRALNRRLDPLGWLSLGLLTFTGLIQMEANPSYTGLLSFSNLWSQAIFIKHIFFIGMILASAYMTWVMSPAIQHAALMRTRGRRDKSGQTWQHRLQQLITINLILGVLVLVFTALARIS